MTREDRTAEPAGTPGRHAGSEPSREDGYTRGQWMWDHSGRLAGIALAVGAFVFMVFLAAIGFKPALFLVVLLVVGVVVIAVGGRIRGA